MSNEVGATEEGGGGGENKSLLLVGNKMREQIYEQIKELQEKRAAALMNEITVLQKERDISLARLKQFEIYNTELKEENWALKEACGQEADLKLELSALKQQYVEEKLLVNDLKKKLQSLEKKNTELTSKLPAMTGSYYSPSLHHLRPPANAMMKDVTNKGIHSASSSPVHSPFSSPGLIPRRYKLATISSCHQETQTEIAPVQLAVENLPRPVLEALRTARDDLVNLQDQNENLSNKLKRLTLEKEKKEAMQRHFSEKYEVLKQESAILRESLSQFSQWVQVKISSVEEEMDICKVIYSLHGSLSKERETIEEMRQKMVTHETSVNQLTTTNEYLNKALTDTQIQLQQSQAEAKLLREQLRKALKHASRRTLHGIHHLPSSPHSSPLVKLKIKRSPRTNHHEQSKNLLSSEYI